MRQAKPRATQKGRSLDDAALADVRAILGERPRRRDLLIEFLHLLHDQHGGLSRPALKALAYEMRLSEAEVFEVASFYHHFDILEEGATPAPLTVRVCDSVSCMLAGAEALLTALAGSIDASRIRLVRAPCVGRCDQAPVVVVGQRALGHATAADVATLIDAGETEQPLPASACLLDAYCQAGGYGLLHRLRAGEVTAESMIATLSDAGLRGLGGAGFPAGRKWQIVRGMPGPTLMTVNADEGEPGTFKDRVLLESDPHRMLEGALIAAEIVQAERIYIYLRDEYPGIRALLTRELAALEAAGLLIRPVELRRGAGAYICGEESAMLESIEGKRGLPRHRPPYIAESGLFGRPTLNHNVETLFHVREIIEKGAAWFAAQGMNGAKGMRCFSVSGRVRAPGVKRAPAGITARALIDDYAGGMADGHVFAGYLPGGASGGMLPASAADQPLDFGSLDALGCFVGSHAIVVFSDQDDPKAIARNLMNFFEHESCGQCTPCRAGTAQLHALMQREAWDEALMRDVAEVMRDASICGLGQAAPNPLLSVLRFFNPEAGDARHEPAGPAS